MDGQVGSGESGVPSRRLQTPDNFRSTVRVVPAVPAVDRFGLGLEGAARKHRVVDSPPTTLRVAASLSAFTYSSPFRATRKSRSQILSMNSIACSLLIRCFPGMRVNTEKTSATLCAPQHPVDRSNWMNRWRLADGEHGPPGAVRNGCRPKRRSFSWFLPRKTTPRDL
jgi:hypothetical protein